MYGISVNIVGRQLLDNREGRQQDEGTGPYSEGLSALH